MSIRSIHQLVEVHSSPIELVHLLVSLSIVQNLQVELAKACLVGNHVDRDDLTIHNREFENEYRLIQMTRDDAYRFIHEHRIHAAPGTTGKLVGLLGNGL
ncbi:hypothetical protein AAXB25_29390 [Paenibacillus lautus]|uniref:hypothetical protein n=1 Tax=Paenibacillus lautus TaxID=1401 RepID=UPI003D2C4B8E